MKLEPLTIFKKRTYRQKYNILFAYLPKNKYADVVDFRKKVYEILKSKDQWIELHGKEIVEWFEKKYKPKGCYLIIEQIQEKVQANFVTGEIIKDWDVRLEALMSVKL